MSSPVPQNLSSVEAGSWKDVVPWRKGKPSDLDGLFDFYHNYTKLLYAAVQTENDLPQEVLFEYNAALDHISRIWTYQADKDLEVQRAYGHFKRACLDIFKVRLRKAVDQCAELRRVDLTVIDNGQFTKNMNERMREIQELATRARQMEGQPDTDVAVPAFELWERVFILCIEFEEECYFHKHLNWARKHGFKAAAKRQGVGFVLGVCASLVAAGIWYLGGRLLEKSEEKVDNLSVPKVESASPQPSN